MKPIEYTEEFEAWWSTVEHLYAHNVGILTESFKEVSFRAWKAGHTSGGYITGYLDGYKDGDNGTPPEFW